MRSPAMATITFGCAHEHIDRPRSCAACAVDVQHCAGDMICPHCREAAEPHACMCLVVVDWDSGERRSCRSPARFPHCRSNPVLRRPLSGSFRYRGKTQRNFVSETRYATL